jgi:hypothetical protein
MESLFGKQIDDESRRKSKILELYKFRKPEREQLEFKAN